MSIQSQTALRLYRSILSQARKFNDYSLQSYIQRRAKQHFRENTNIPDTKKIRQLLVTGQEELQVIRRQRIIQNLYFGRDNILQSTKKQQK